MGCTPSVPTTSPDESLSDKFGPPPPIPVEIGSGIRHNLNHDVIIVFIFGGPASRKGLIIQELTRSFNFTSIAVEDIVFNYLPTRVGNTVDSIGEIQEALKRDNGLLTLDWIFSMISGRLSTSMHQRFVIDIVPTLSSIMKAESFRQRNHDRSLEQFERRHPIAFALEINVADERTLLTSRDGGRPNQNNRENNNHNNNNSGNGAENPELTNYRNTIEDYDRGRLEKRLEDYHNCSIPFIRYFQKSRRVVKLSVKTDAFSNLVPTAKDIFMDFGFTLTRRDEHILVFSTETTHEDIDLSYYKLKVVNASELCKASDELSTQIAAVYKYITSHSRHDDNFLVIVPNFNYQDPKSNKRINFMEKKKEVYLDEFISNKQHDKQPKERIPVSVNCISSSRQTFLFFEPFPTSLAQTISLLYNRIKDNPSSTKETEPPGLVPSTSTSENSEIRRPARSVSALSNHPSPQQTIGFRIEKGVTSCQPNENWQSVRVKKT
ncbi:unnamed protein product [Caenorhabditis angaria]|uniref:Uncharacterized protein n=1 Tax=Caenorhabditis angaria TaxID=860376 RepID=A0A9P1IQL8_9PELO|nr:unnamed protein product [Caenorhabditis angaria]